MVHGSDSAESAAREAASSSRSSAAADGLAVWSSPRARRSGGRSSSSSGVAVRGRRRGRRGARARATPREVAVENALRKARAVAAAAAGCRVLGVDTVVALDGALYGKPRRRGEARATLRALAGRTHAVAQRRVRWSSRARRARDRRRATEVTFRALDDACSTGTWPPASGAGAPAATRSRGAAPRWCERIEGDYLNVVGLPVAALSTSAGTGLAGLMRALTFCRTHVRIRPTRVTPAYSGISAVRVKRGPGPRAGPLAARAASRSAGLAGLPASPAHRYPARLDRSLWASSATSPASAAATWRSTSAPPTRSSTCAGAASCSPSRRSSRSTRARGEVHAVGHRGQAHARPHARARSRPSAR